MWRVDVAETQKHELYHVIEHWEALHIKSAAHVLPLHSWVVTLTSFSSSRVKHYQEQRNGLTYCTIKTEKDMKTCILIAVLCLKHVQPFAIL